MDRTLAPLPVTVVTGFLGAGKTTLVNRWLGDAAPGDIAVIVNEHGDVGIDGELLAERADRMRVLVEITGGCICCRTQAELVRALEKLASSRDRPTRILVETSGAASPAGVLRAIATGGRAEASTLDGVITVVDAARIAIVATHDLAFEQLGYADIVVLSRADAVAAEVLAHAREVVSERNGAALVVEAARGAIVSPPIATLDELLDRRRADFVSERVAAVVAPPPHEYESVSLVIEGDVDGERFADFVENDLAGVGGRIFRTKGIIAVAGMNERMIVQGVADLVDVTFGRPWGDAARRSRLVVVGFGLDREGLERGFAACAVHAARST